MLKETGNFISTIHCSFYEKDKSFSKKIRKQKYNNNQNKIQ